MKTEYFKVKYTMGSEYIAVKEKDSHFYKGMSIGFDYTEERFDRIEMDRQLNFKAVKFIMTKSTKEEFEKAFDKAIKQIKDKKNEH